MFWRNLTAAVCLVSLLFAGCADKKAPAPPPDVEESETTTDPPEVDLGAPAGTDTDQTDDAAAGEPASGDTSATTGTLRGKFVYDGTPPTPAKLAVTKDTEVCAAHAPVDESLVVGADGGIANILIWVRSEATTEPPAGEAVLDNKDCRFDPHVMVVHTGQALKVTNSDSIGHNSNLSTSLNPAVNTSVPPNGEQEYTFSQEERLPAKVSCGIHPWMTGWVLVSDDTYNAVTKEDGTFEITGLPLGEELEFQVWQEKAGYLSDVSLASGEEWPRGRFTKSFTGDVDLGVIKVSPQAFQ